MPDVTLADGFDSADTLALGLAAPQLGVALAGLAGAYLLAQSPLPLLLRVPLIVVLGLLASVFAWGRWQGRPLLDWAILAVRFGLSKRAGTLVLGVAGADPASEHPGGAAVRKEQAGSGSPVERGQEPAGSSSPVEPSTAFSPPTSAARPDCEPEWARWLDCGPGGAGSGGSRPDQVDVAEDCPVMGEPAPAAGLALDVKDASPPANSAIAMERPSLAAGSRLDAEVTSPTDVPAAAGEERVVRPTARAGLVPAGLVPAAVGDVVEMGRTPLVLLPTPGSGPPDHDLPEGELEVDDDAPAVTPLLRPPRWPDQAVTGVPVIAPGMVADADGPVAVAGPVPMFVGATRRLTFFSLNGGSGRTTLATEVACLLAARGRHQAAQGEPDRRLRVALLDLDLSSATVSVHLGIPQPTVLDYLTCGDDDGARMADFMVAHPSGLRALLGPPKPLTSGPLTLDPARVAELVRHLEHDGIHFIVIDVGGDLNAVTSWVLGAVHDIYVVLTPTASGVQDAYRTTEMLRRRGLAGKLRYVVNRARGPVDMSEVMTDLGGRVVATIPFDEGIEDAENHHRIAALHRGGPAVEGIRGLAAHIYPGLAVARREPRLRRLLRWRGTG